MPDQSRRRPQFRKPLPGLDPLQALNQVFTDLSNSNLGTLIRWTVDEVTTYPDVVGYDRVVTVYSGLGSNEDAQLGPVANYWSGSVLRFVALDSPGVVSLYPYSGERFDAEPVDDPHVVAYGAPVTICADPANGRWIRLGL